MNQDKEYAFDAVLSCFMLAFMDLYRIYDYDEHISPYKEFTALWNNMNELERYYRRNTTPSF